MYIHPAHTVDYDTLVSNLALEIEAGNVSTAQDGPLVMYRYTQQCVFDRNWNQWNLVARGLILDTEKRCIAACTMPKFFNWSEIAIVIPDEPFEVTEKLDGSLGIVFFHNKRWRVATRGSFKSEQAIWAETWLNNPAFVNLDELSTSNTYLVEIVYSANRIVVAYDFEGLVLLTGYNSKGQEFNRKAIESIAAGANLDSVASVQCDGIDDLLTIAKTLSTDKEGFVVRFESGLRIKIKGDEYCRVHRLISHVTPLAVWDMMAACDDLTLVARELPEEFRKDFDAITELLSRQFDTLIERIRLAAEYVKSMSDKELGLWLSTQHMFDENVARFVFSVRKKNLLAEAFKPVKMRRRLFETFRPTGNVLPGYTPSSLLNRFTEETSA